MSINTLGFLAFLLFSAVLYYAVPRKGRWLVLLAASIGFYLSYHIGAAIHLATATAVTFLFALRLDRLGQQKPHADDPTENAALLRRWERHRGAVLAVALGTDFAALFVLKYSGFCLSAANELWGTRFAIPSFLLPIGLSFYTFQTAGYLIDVYRGRIRAQRNFARYALFVCYFPQMLQGPIQRYDALSGPLFDGNDFDWNNIQNGFFRILYGILKKALIADALAPIVATIYNDFAAYPGVVSFAGAALYCVQLYCDFSGGIDVVCGASRLFGIRMQENFRQPYFAVSLADFWRRWHISLGEWMKDYLFYPLALSRFGARLTKLGQQHLPARAARCFTPAVLTVIVFLAVGIWQGPGMANVAYGLWNGLWMAAELCWVHRGSRTKPHRRIRTLAGILFTDLLVIIGRYFSNSASLKSALAMLWHTVTAAGFSALNGELLLSLGVTPLLAAQVILALGVVLAVSLARERGADPVAWILGRKALVQFLIVFAGLFLAVFFVYANGGYTPIAYVYESV